MTRRSQSDQPARRDFLKTTAAASMASTLAVAQSSALGGYFAGGNDELRVGVIGCGGRGTGAVEQACNAGPNIKLVAIGDMFPERVEGKFNYLKKALGDRFQATKDTCFSGFDAYKGVLATNANFIILATPPGFRPMHLRATVAAGKHIFTEKPVAVDGPGVRECILAYEEAKEKGLGIAAGTQRRHQTGYLEAMKRVHDGQIGDVVAARCYWNQGRLWHVNRTPTMSDMEWQLRNWLYFTWLSGDHIVEQHVHNLDVVNWGMQRTPKRAVGMGGRQARTEPHFGHIYDHFAVDYEYGDGKHAMSMCRQIDQCEQNVSECLVGTKGILYTSASRRQYEIVGENKWRMNPREDNEPYQQEHINLVQSIRSGKPINELLNVAHSTLTAIMGRMSCYTGKAVTWEQALNSKENLLPKTLSMGELPVPPVAIPGRTELL